MTPEQIESSYRSEFGSRALAIPSDQGMDRAMWAVPVTLMAIAVVAFILTPMEIERGAFGRRSTNAERERQCVALDNRLDEELRKRS
ncbi:MAG: hypothetical protein R3A47_00405 [Polyangiales bacterium]